jgi:hypothetical protein
MVKEKLETKVVVGSDYIAIVGNGVDDCDVETISQFAALGRLVALTRMLEDLRDGLTGDIASSVRIERIVTKSPKPHLIVGWKHHDEIDTTGCPELRFWSDERTDRAKRRDRLHTQRGRNRDKWRNMPRSKNHVPVRRSQWHDHSF